MMNIDEAIAQAERIAEGQEKSAELSPCDHAKERISKSAAEHRQLAAWLRELKKAKRFIREIENRLYLGTSFYPTSFLKENEKLFDELTKGVEYLDD